MSERPTVDVAIVAWPVSPARLAYCQTVVHAVESYLRASRHAMRIAVSIGQEQDPLRRWCGQELMAYLDYIGIKHQRRQRLEQERLGYAMNEAVAMCSADYVLLVQDDSLLREPLNLSDGIDLMEEDRDIDLIRYGWSTRRELAITTHPYRQGWLRVDINGHWPYSDNTHLRRGSFPEKFGTYCESRTHGESEQLMRKEVESRKAMILVPDRGPLFHSFGIEPSDFRTPTHKGMLQRLRGGPKQ